MNQKKIKTELFKRIDKKDSIKVEKVERYLNLINLFYKLDESIEEYGVMMTTINGSQEFTKPNPVISEKNKINSSLIALGKDLGLDDPIKSEANNYNKSDLI